MLRLPLRNNDSRVGRECAQHVAGCPEVYQQQLETYKADHDAATKLLAVGSFKAREDLDKAELAAFVEAVTKKKPMPVGAEDGREAIVLAEAAVKSLKTGKPVKINR